MTEHLYAKFLQDAGEYAASERHWQQLAATLAASLGQVGEWAPWIPRSTPNGTPIARDGNPIHDGRSLQLKRAYRIIQHPCTRDRIELAAWLKAYDEELSELPSDELVINLCLSHESSRLTERLLSKWMAPTTTRVSMQAFIDEIVGSPK